MPYLKLNFNYTESSYSIPTKRDGTTAILPDNHTAVKYFNAVKPPHFLNGLQNFTGIIYAISSSRDPYATMFPFDRTMQYYIKI